MMDSMAVRRWILGITVVLSLAGLVHAQPDESMAALRRENEALRQRVARLEAQLEAAREESKLLREQMESLREAMRALTRELETRPREVTEEQPEDEVGEVVQEEAPRPPEYPDPLLADPLDYPAALLAALQASYAESLDAEDAEEERLSIYLNEVRRWAAGVNRMYRGRIDWVVTVADEEGAIPMDQPLRVFVVDRETLQKLHRDPFVVDLDARDRRRVDEESSREAWRMTGFIEAEVRVNPEREDRGVFNTPAFIGPYAEFGYELRIGSVTAWVVDGEED